MTHNYWFTELLDNAISLILLLTISLLHLKRVVTMASIAPPPWHEPNMVHVRLLFLQPYLYDVHSCSLLFVGELDELQHFIQSLECIERGKFMCKAPRVFIFGSTMFSCIRPESLWYNSISPYGNLEMYIMGYIFIEGLISWRQCFGVLTSVSPTLVGQALILASAKVLQCAWA